MITLIIGSLRNDSYNKKVAKLCASWLEAKTLEKITLINLNQYQLPLYSGDIETNNGLPQKAIDLAEIIRISKGIIFISPEYNGGIPGALKNTIDWISRISPNPWSQKNYCLMGATTGGFGTIKGMSQLNQVLWQMQGIVAPSFFSLSYANKAFTEEGNFREQENQVKLINTIKSFISFLNIVVMNQDTLTEPPNEK